jgi:hypothetical protein
LFETLGLDYERRLSLSGIMNVVQLVAVMIALVYIERFGRKTWLFIGSIGMTLSHVVVAGMIGEPRLHLLFQSVHQLLTLLDLTLPTCRQIL